MPVWQCVLISRGKVMTEIRPSNPHQPINDLETVAGWCKSASIRLTDAYSNLMIIIKEERETYLKAEELQIDVENLYNEFHALKELSLLVDERIIAFSEYFSAVRKENQ